MPLFQQPLDTFSVVLVNIRGAFGKIADERFESCRQIGNVFLQFLEQELVVVVLAHPINQEDISSAQLLDAFILHELLFRDSHRG